jgi:hypothetical protein
LYQEVIIAFSGLSGTTAIFRPEGNIPFFSTAPTSKRPEGIAITEDYQEK